MCKVISGGCQVFQEPTPIDTRVRGFAVDRHMALTKMSENNFSKSSDFIVRFGGSYE